VTGHDPLGYGWWLSARAAGIVAYLALSAAVVLGLAMALRVAPVSARPALRAAHERIAVVSLVALAAHALFLLADPWLKAGLAGIVVPFANPYRPFWTGLGVLAAYLATALSLSYYARRRIGSRRWRSAHRLIPVAWALAAVHVIGAGTDAGSLWMQAPLALTVSLCLIMLGYRWLGSPAPRQAPSPSPSPRAPQPERARLWSAQQRVELADGALPREAGGARGAGGA
jgi:methionine sulfoxide reductase heme-binding subunit